MYLSAQDGHLPLVKLLAERGKIDVNRISNVSVSQLFCCILSIIISINLMHDGFSAIWIACQRGHLPVVKYLKERGARLDYMCKVGIHR